MSISSMFGEAVRLLRRHPSVFMGLAALQVVPQLLLAVWLEASGIGRAGANQLAAILDEFNRRVQDSNNDPQFIADIPWGLPTDAVVRLLVWSTIIFFLQYFVFRTIAMGATTAAVGDAYTEQAPSWGRAIGSALRHLPALAGWGILAGLATIGSAALLLIPCLGAFVWLGLLLFLGIRLLLVPQIIIAENVGPFGAMSRSWQLTKGSWWRIFGAFLLFVVVVGLAASLIGTVLSGIVLAAAGDGGLSLAFTQGISTILSLLTMPLAYIGFTLLYYEQQRYATTPPPPPPVYPVYPPYQ